MITRTLAQIAELCGAAIDGDGAREITGPATLEEATPNEVSFLGNTRYTSLLATTQAAAVLVGLDVADVPDGPVLLRCEDPNRAFTKVIAEFRPQEERPAPGVHERAVVEEGVERGPDVAIGAGCIVGARARLGARVVLHPGVVIGPDARVGDDTVVYPTAVLYHGVEVGNRCVIHAGVVIGSDGFGFDPTPKGWIKIPQCGTVVVEDDVEIGANCTIDRGRFGATRIGRGSKLDNLVHVAHNVVIGAGSILIAQVGVAGSARIGKGVVLAGQTGVLGHVTVGDGARVAAKSAVLKSIEGGQDYTGIPVRPRMQQLRSQAAANRIPELIDRVRALEGRLAELEEE